MIQPFVRTAPAAMAFAGLAILAPARARPAEDEAARPAAIVEPLAARSLACSAGKEIQMMTVEYLPGGASLPHRHDAQVFVYVLDGRIRMQIEGAAPVILGRGETFYEGPEDIHVVSANASASEGARMLVFIVKDAHSPVSIPVVPRVRP